MIRQAILSLSTSDLAKRTVTRMPVTSSIVTRFVAGDDEPAALTTARELVGHGLRVTFDNLGEYVTDVTQAHETAQAYESLLSTLKDAGLADKCEVSVKLSAVGQFLGSDGHAIALDNARKICLAARDAGTTVTLDAEDYTTTDSRLEILAELRSDFPETGTVIQAMLHRTERDAAALSGEGMRVRLCKGAYREPEAVAFTDKPDIDRSYVRCLKVLMKGQGYPMVATHDPRLVAIADSLADRAGRSRDSFEFQMLMGIRPEEQQRLAASGYQMRIYVPYGDDWYGYLMRRLAEKPSNMALFLKSLSSKK